MKKLKKGRIEKLVLAGVMGMSTLCFSVMTNTSIAAETMSLADQQAFYAPTDGKKDYSLQEVSTTLANTHVYAVQGEKVDYLIVNDDDAILVGADLDNGNYEKLKSAIEKKVSIENLSVALTDSRVGLSDKLKKDGAKIYVASMENTITLDNGTTGDTSDDIVLKSIPFAGHTESSTIWVDKEYKTIFSGDALGDGTVYLRDSGVTLGTYDTQKTLKMMELYQGNLDSLLGKINDSTKCYSNNKIVDKAYVQNVKTIVDDIISVNHSRIHTWIKGGVNGDMTTNLRTEEGSAVVIWHLPSGGFHGYDLSGKHFKGKGYDFFTLKFDLDNGNVLYNLRDTDVQSHYVMMNDKEALLHDTDMYGDITKAVKDLIEDRELTIWISHPHPDHIGGLPEFLKDCEVRQKAAEGKTMDKVDWEFPKASALSEGQLKRIYYPVATADNAIMQEFKKQGVDVIDTKSGMTFTCAGKEFEVYQMKGHTAGDMALINKTDRIMFPGDVLGTESFAGGYGIGAAPYQEILDTLNHMWEKDSFDYYFQAHRPYMIPKSNMKTNILLVESYIKFGKAASIDGRQVIVQNGKLITSKEELNAIEKIDMNQFNSANASLSKFKKTDSIIEAKDLELKVGDKATVTVETNNNEGQLTYTSSDESIAVVDENGVVTGLKEGSCEITISAPVTANYDVGNTKITITVEKKALDNTDKPVTPDKPVVPEEPTNPDTPKPPVDDNQSQVGNQKPIIKGEENKPNMVEDTLSNKKVQTWDSAQIIPYTVLVLLSGGLLVTFNLKRRESE